MSAEDKAREALDAMPDLVGTPGTSAYQRSLESVSVWYVHYYQILRQCLSEHAELESSLREIVDASNSEAASGGEMFWSKAVGPAVDKAARLLKVTR